MTVGKNIKKTVGKRKVKKMDVMIKIQIVNIIVQVTERKGRMAKFKRAGRARRAIRKLPLKMNLKTIALKIILKKKEQNINYK